VPAAVERSGGSVALRVARAALVAAVAAAAVAVVAVVVAPLAAEPLRAPRQAPVAQWRPPGVSPGLAPAARLPSQRPAAPCRTTDKNRPGAERHGRSRH